MEGKLFTRLEKAFMAGGLAITVATGVFTTRYIERKVQERNCELYGNLQRLPENIQRKSIETNLAEDNFAYRRDHPLAVKGYIIDLTVNEILEDINNCQ